MSARPAIDLMPHEFARPQPKRTREFFLSLRLSPREFLHRSARLASMKDPCPRRPARLLGRCLAVTMWLGALSASAESRERALVLASAPDDVDSAIRAGLSGKLTAHFADSASLVVIPASEVQVALAARQQSASDCARDKSCAADLARKLNAKVYVTGILEHSGKTYVLTLVRNGAAEEKPRTTFERMMRLSNLDLNVQLCMGRLFPPSEPAPAAPPPAAPTPVDPAAPQPARPRVVIVATGDAAPESVVALPDQIAHALEGQPVDVVSPSDTRKAFAARAESLTECQKSRKCRQAVARSLRADVILTATLELAGRAWLLTMARGDLGEGELPGTSERMKKLSSLALNIHLCVGRLFPGASPAMADLSLEETPAAPSTAPAASAPEAAQMPVPAPASAQAPAAAPVAAVPAGTGARVVIVAAAREGVDRATGAGFAAEIARELAQVHPSEIVPVAEVQRVLVARDDSARDCLDRAYCAAAVASKLDARILVTATLEHSKGTYLLTMTSGKPLQPDRQSTSERMRQLSNLGLNVSLCLSRLFAPVTTAATQGN